MRGRASHILALFTASGFADAYITQDAFDTDAFLDGFAAAVLPWVKPYPGPDSVVVIDNCSCHHADPSWIVEVYRRGGRVRFLPPYSPTFQPIETGIYHAKDWMQKQAAARAECASDEEFLRMALFSVGPAHAAMAFDSCTWQGERVYGPSKRV